MKGDLYQSDLDFIEEAKQAFEKDHRLRTWRNKEDTLIALRYGEDNDCIRLFELGAEKAFFHNIMKKCPVETIKKESSKTDETNSVFIIEYTSPQSPMSIKHHTYFTKLKEAEEFLMKENYVCEFSRKYHHVTDERLLAYILEFSGK